MDGRYKPDPEGKGAEELILMQSSKKEEVQRLLYIKAPLTTEGLC